MSDTDVGNEHATNQKHNQRCQSSVPNCDQCAARAPLSRAWGHPLPGRHRSYFHVNRRVSKHVTNPCGLSCSPSIVHVHALANRSVPVPEHVLQPDVPLPPAGIHLPAPAEVFNVVVSSYVLGSLVCPTIAGRNPPTGPK